MIRGKRQSFAVALLAAVAVIIGLGVWMAGDEYAADELVRTDVGGQ